MLRVFNSIIFWSATFIALTGCSSIIPDDGRVVSEGGTPAKDDRIAYYEMQAEKGLSAPWVDQYICLITVDTVIAEAETIFNNYYSSFTGISYGLAYDAAQLQQDIEEASEMGDTKLANALKKVPELGEDLAYGNISLDQAFDAIIDVCDPYEHSQEDLDRTLTEAARWGEELSELRYGTFSFGPTFLAESGTYSDSDRPIGLHHFSEGSSEVEHYDDTCETHLADLIIEYAYGDISAEEVLEPFPETEHDFLREHLEFVRQEIDSGSVPPELAGTLMGRVTLGNNCDIN